ncbi:hypothetical protein [Actinokineospora sp. UTMC 2448]|uniref:DUF7878 domain-containing protein n=1 Tax=Actinokineospora sp. UTMC 2448 TaxID=2268449 RepID=UPI002164EF15|nr:hypothetical protein [Actinokineospora sp. UTMC 2448]UVS80891.1 hypothetical protein Actkin_04643 [Actinokineospora sp. UTMC 2448]
MRFEYENLNADDLRGATVLEYLVNVEADVRLLDDAGEVLYSESDFPVLELACHLLAWWQDGAERGPFTLDDTMVGSSFSEPGVIRFDPVDGGQWLFSSVFHPDRSGYRVTAAEMAAAVSEFAERLRADLPALRLDPALVAAETVR